MVMAIVDPRCGSGGDSGLPWRQRWRRVDKGRGVWWGIESRLGWIYKYLFFYFLSSDRFGRDQYYYMYDLASAWRFIIWAHGRSIRTLAESVFNHMEEIFCLSKTCTSNNSLWSSFKNLGAS